MGCIMRRSLPAILLVLLPIVARARITGTVVSETGEPLKGAHATAFPIESRRAFLARVLAGEERTPLATAESGADGRFALDVPRQSPAEIHVTSGGREFRRVDAMDGADVGVVLLRPASRRTIRVVAGGKAVSGAVVIAGRTLAMKTSAEGTVEVPESLASEVIAVHPDHPIAYAQPRRFEIALAGSKPIRGRVVNADGTPAPGAAIEVDGFPLATSSEDGSFVVTRAPAAWRGVVARLGDRIAAAPRAACCELKLARPAQVAGAVFDIRTGSPAAGVRVMIDATGTNETQFTDTRGRFSFTDLPPGALRVHVADPLWFRDGSESASLAAGERKELRLSADRAAEVTGVVVTPAGAPVARALVGPPGAVGRVPSLTALTDARGRFVVRARRSERAELQAMKRGFAAGDTTVDTDAEAIGEVSIALEEGFALVVRAVDSAKEPVAGVTVNLMRIDQEGRRGRLVPCPLGGDCPTVTGADGSVTFDIAPGIYDVALTGTRTVPVRLAKKNLTPESSPLVVVVEPGVEISGRVVFSDGTPAGRGMVRSENSGPEGPRAQIEPDGTFRMENAAPGAVTLVAEAVEPVRLRSEPKEITAPASGVVLTLPRAGRIAGRVVDASTQQPITDFSVQVQRSGSMGSAPPVQRSEGRFSVEAEPGRYTVYVTARGYARGSATGIEVVEGMTAEDIEVRLERGGRVAGRVTAAGKPVAGVAVQVMEGPAPQGMTIRLDRITTDADGSYAIDTIGAGEQTIVFTRSGFRPKRERVEIAAGKDVQLDIELDRGREIRGRVVDESGRPVAEAEVRTDAPRPGARTRSAADGSFRLGGIDPERVTLRVEKSGFVEAREVVEPQASAVTLTLRRGATITGRVTGLTREEISQVRVFASGMGVRTDGEVDGDGNFTVRGVPEGRVMLSAATFGATRRQAPSVTVEVRGGSAPPVDIDFAPGFKIGGRVTRNGGAFADAAVYFRSLSREHSGSARTTRSGAYEVQGLAAGAYRVSVAPEGSGGEVWSGRLDVGGDATFDIDVRSAVVRGRTIDDATGSTLAGVSLWFQPLRRDGARGNAAVSDSSGRFVAELLPDRYQVRAQKPSYATATQEIDASAGGEVEIRMARVEPTSVRIADAKDGRPVAATVWVESGGGSATAGDDGIARFSLMPGNYRLRASARGYVTATASITVPGPEVRVALARAGAILLRSRSGAPVRARLAGGSSPAVITAGRAFEGIVPGSYTLEIVGDAGTVVDRRPVTVIEGQLTTVDVD